MKVTISSPPNFHSLLSRAETYHNQEAIDLFLLSRYTYTAADRINSFLRSIISSNYVFPRHTIILTRQEILRFSLVTRRVELDLILFPTRYLDLGINTVVLQRAIIAVREFLARQLSLISRQTNLV